MQALVIQDHQGNNLDPISFKQGDHITILRYSTMDDGWLNWVDCQFNQQTGWVPIQYLTITNDQAIAKQDYDAKELTVNTGQIITITTAINGWTWGITQDQQGWIPDEKIRPISQP